jgi:hypothetical protein
VENPAPAPGILNLMMRKRLALLLYFILASPYPFSAQDNADVAKIEKQLVDAHGGKEADLRTRLAKALVLQATDEYEQDHVDQAEKSLEKTLAECNRAATAAIAAGKKEKTVEIRLREISVRLNEITRVVPFDNRAYIEQVRQSVEALRTKLLDHMFKKK